MNAEFVQGSVILVHMAVQLWGFLLAQNLLLQHGIHRYVGKHRTSAGGKTILSDPLMICRDRECWACAAGEREFALLSITGSETGKEFLLSSS